MNTDAENNTLINELLSIMKMLRSDQGCPWDRKQTHSSITNNLIEETYEVIDAIDRNDMNHLKEELGDLLLQVVFHAQIASEKQYFLFEDIVKELIQKLIRRHPHVFGDKTASNSEEALSHWEKIKKEEKKDLGLFDSIPNHLPSLLLAKKIQSKVSKLGFDWENIEGALEKLKEEFDELFDAIRADDKQNIEEEIGDLLFSIVNCCRFLKICSDEALRKSIHKFKQRYLEVEKLAQNKDIELSDANLKQLNQLWDQAKVNLSKTSTK